jgi:hypothetical protein
MGSLSASTDLALLVIPGAASPASFYQDFVKEVRQLTGLQVDVYSNPSGRVSDPPAGLTEDGRFWASKIEELISQGKEVVLLPHSYGGLVANEAVKGLELATRQQQGLAGGVKRIIYVTCVVGGVGESSSEVCSPLNFDWLLPMDGVSTIHHNTPQVSD